MTVRAAAAASGCRYRLVLAWARNGELQATDWDPSAVASRAAGVAGVA